MKVFQRAFIVLLFAVFLVSHVQAQDLIVFPAQGQSNEQMEKDKFECYTWARDQTGFDPMDNGYFGGNRPGGADGLRRSGGFCGVRCGPAALAG
jgi:hypothetical protein